MALSKTDRARELARIAGIPIAAEELDEVAGRLDCVLTEVERLTGLDLDGIEPVSIFPEEADRGER